MKQPITKEPKTIHIKQKFVTRPIEIYTEFEDLTEVDFDNIKEIERLYTDACENMFVAVLYKAIHKYSETGVVPTLDEVMKAFGREEKENEI